MDANQEPHEPDLIGRYYHCTRCETIILSFSRQAKQEIGCVYCGGQAIRGINEREHAVWYERLPYDRKFCAACRFADLMYVRVDDYAQAYCCHPAVQAQFQEIQLHSPQEFCPLGRNK